MSNTPFLDAARKLGPYLESQAEASDEHGKLIDETVTRFKELGFVRMLQPKEYGGYETEPLEFFDTVIELGSHAPAAGWVAGVVGVHPFEIAVADRRVQEEIWGEDPDTWIASPYAPFGRAKQVEGGYIFSGRWQFSSGTSHCQWIVLGGLIVDSDGKPIVEHAERHFVLPRADYEIIEGSWNTVGLKGSGSKDVVITDAFVPDYRVIDPIDDLETYAGAERAGRGDNPLYHMPFHVMFGSIISAQTLGIAKGALQQYIAYTQQRVTARGKVAVTDPHMLHVLGHSASEIDASLLQYRDTIQRMWDLAVAGEEVDVLVRTQVRRDQVTAVHRAADAVDRLVELAGGGAMRLEHPLQRFWRDLHTALGHTSNIADRAYANWGLTKFGVELDPGARA